MTILMRSLAFGHLTLLLAATLTAEPTGPQPSGFTVTLTSGNLETKQIGKTLGWDGDPKDRDDAFASAETRALVTGGKLEDGRTANWATATRIRFGSYTLRYRIWSLFGEPVFDFQFLWENPTSVVPSKAWQLANKTGVVVPDFAAMPGDLRAALLKVRPLSVTFRFDITNRSYLAEPVFSSRSVLVRYKAGPRVPPSLLVASGSATAGFFPIVGARNDPAPWEKLPPFSVDLPAPAGVWQDFSVPGSPRWQDLPTYFRQVFRDRRDVNDLLVSDVSLLSVVWPTSEIESILTSWVNAQVSQRQTAAAESPDFWDQPVARTELPMVAPPADSSAGMGPGSTPGTQEARRHYQELQASEARPVVLAPQGQNGLRVTLAPALRRADLVLRDAGGTELGRARASAGGDTLELTAPRTVARVEAVLDGEVVGTFPWAFSDRPVFRLGDKGPGGGVVFFDKGNDEGGWRYLEVWDELFSRNGPWKDRWISMDFDADKIALSAGSLTRDGLGAGLENCGNMTAELAKRISANQNRYGWAGDPQRKGFAPGWYLPSIAEVLALRAFALAAPLPLNPNLRHEYSIMYTSCATGSYDTPHSGYRIPQVWTVDFGTGEVGKRWSSSEAYIVLIRQF